MSSKNQVRTRFAPSPTGYLHIGGLRTALYAYLIAKQASGQFVLRLEDTDLERYVAGAAEAIYSGLKWAGLHYDEGPDIGGPYAPYVQSQRLDTYKKYANELVAKGHAYYCFCDKKTLEEMRQEQVAKKQAPKYDRLCFSLSQEKIDVKLKAGEPHVVRMKIPAGRVIEVNDLVRGKVSYKSEELDDQVLLKSDGYPTYHLAVVVDDHLMKISHVTRTEEWLPSTPKHILLYEYFGWQIPQFAHFPLILNPDKTKMSKRTGDVAMGNYIKKGYLPEAMINYLAFLGWNPGTAKEIYSMEELLKEFSLERVHKAGAIFNIEKLNWYNGHYIKQMPLDKLTGMCIPYLPDPVSHPERSEGSKIKKIVALEQERLQVLSEIGEHTAFFFALPPFDKALLKWKEMNDEEIKKSLDMAKDIITNTPDSEFTKEKLSETLLAEAAKMPNKGYLLWPLRVALSGQKNSPPPFDIAEILGKEESLERIKTAVYSIG
ncbi:glutamate--tRNA ligase [Patescibacteria group bacterium]|nr:glutamate--tRNA ligase [Patescibacteria group bacterium]